LKTIKTREKARGIKVLDKSVSLSKRMKDSYIRTKHSAEETQDSDYSSPSEYAGGTVQNAVSDARHLPNPAKKARKSIDRTKGHLEDVRRQTPAERKRAAEQAQQAAQKAKSKAQDLRKTADKADKTAQSAKSAVSDAKQELKRVRYEGRRTVQQAKRQASAKPQAPDIPAKASPNAPGYMNKGVTASKSVAQPAKALQSQAKAVKSTGKSFKDTAKGTVKTAKKSVKTAERTAKKAVKTARQAAKTAQKTAQATAKAAKLAERTARAAAKTAAKTAKAAARAVAAMVKGIIAATKALVSAIVAGGWVALLIILVVCLIGLLVASPFGLFFSSEPSESGMTINGVIRDINDEYTQAVSDITAANPHDLLDMSGARAGWKQVLAVYTVKTTTDPDNPMEVATVDDERAELLRGIFWEMNTIGHSIDSTSVEVDVLDENDMPTGETETVTTTVLRIVVSHKTPEEMAGQYGFSDEQNAQLAELLLPEYHYLWNALLYGITSIGDGSIIAVAESQLGNIGGEPYWSWYGWDERVEWCACFVSWCAEQCGYIEAGIIPMFAGCSVGVQWFKDREQWQDNTYTPRTGDIIFFDWEADGECDHVGIVENVEDGYVNTIEGNTSDSVARRSYELGSVKIYGYGVPLYN
jgi:hypothetical protein